MRARRRARPDAHEVIGTARVDRRTKDLVKRIEPGEIAVINHEDIDRVAGDGLIEAGVAAVVNCAKSVSGRYPNVGPIRIIDAGIPLFALLELARRHHAATVEIANAAVEMFDAHVRQPLLTAELGDDERANRLVDAFRTLLPATGTLVSQHFRRVLLQVAQEHLEAVGDDDERAAARAAGTRRIEDQPKT